MAHPNTLADRAPDPSTQQCHHNYFVSADASSEAFLVHNAGPCPDLSPGTLIRWARELNDTQRAALDPALARFRAIADRARPDNAADAVRLSERFGDEFAEWALENTDEAIELVTNNPQWLDEIADASSLPGRANRMRELLRATDAVPELANVSSDVIRSIGRSSGARFQNTIDDLVAAGGRLADFKPQVLEYILKRADGQELIEALGESDMLARSLNAAAEQTFRADRFIDGWLDLRRRGDDVFSETFSSVDELEAALTFDPLSPAASLPHADSLVNATLSDGSVLSITEDHRLWSISDDAWVEVQDLDPEDEILAASGDAVRLLSIDWSSARGSLAWDLSVSNTHNFFVGAEGGHQVLAHNQIINPWCGVIVGPSEIGRLLAVTAQVDDATIDAISGLIRRNRTNDLPRKMVELLNAADPDDAVAIARNIGRSESMTRQLLDDFPAIADNVLASPGYTHLIDGAFDGPLPTVLSRLQGRPLVEQRRILDELLDSEPAALIGLASLPQGDGFVDDVAQRLGVATRDPVEVADELARYASINGTFAPYDDAIDALDQAAINRLDTVVRNNILGRRFEKQREFARPVNQLYLSRPDGTWVIVDAYDPGVGIFSLKNFQLDDPDKNRMLRALRELQDKYRPNNHTVRNVPSLNAHNARLAEEGLPPLSVGDDLSGQMFLEVPEQTGPFLNKVEICTAAASTGAGVRIIDANGIDLCL